MKRILFLILFIPIVIVGIITWRFLSDFLLAEKGKVITIDNSTSQELVAEPVVVPEEPKVVEPKKSPQSSLIENVPFTAQAPFGEWNDPIFQNGCEEAAIVMAQYWITGKPLTKEIAKKEIAAIAAFEKKAIGQSIDTSAKDTEKIFRDYYGATTTAFRSDITLADIQETLTQGALVLVPTDGRELYNPNYTQPGPTTHVLVVTGYDATTKEFITNDSGTKNGKGYRYDENVLFSAILDYPTGDHLPLKSTSKVMIVVRK
jgi:hypothetical protein